MKYEEELFNISAEASELIDLSDTCQDELVLRLQDELLQELLKKFKEEVEQLKQPWNIRKGILKVTFVDHWRCACEKGFSILSDLIEIGAFDYFAREYCIYLGEVKERTQPLTNGYYEIIWDYKTYFEQAKKCPKGRYAFSKREKEEELPPLSTDTYAKNGAELAAKIASAHESVEDARREEIEELNGIQQERVQKLAKTLTRKDNNKK